MTGPGFRPDLYQGTAPDYDRFRVPYPPALTAGLARRTGADGTGRLLDLACGTGQLAFALRGWFREVWAVDQEPDMIAVVTRKAAGDPGVRALTSPAQDLDAPAASFDLVTIGNAFHRLPRPAVTARVRDWLRPGGYLALAWSDGPWAGTAPWQRAMAEVIGRWTARLAGPGGAPRVPPDWADDRRQRPDSDVLRAAGLEPAGRQELSGAREWTLDGLAGFAFATSVLSRAALGPLVPDFSADLGRCLLAAEPGGVFRQEIGFACELARRPGFTPDAA